MKKLILYTSLLITILYIYSCDKPKEDELVEFKFEIPLTITPTKDTFNIGDTLIVEADFPDSIKEALSGKYYMVSNFDFQTSIVFNHLVSTDLILASQEGSSSSFEVINEVGEIKNIGQTYGDVKFFKENDKYKLRAKIVVKNQSIFCIRFFSNLVGENTSLDFINLGPSASGGQKKATLRNIWYVVNEGNNNFELLKEHCRIAHLTTNPSPDNVNAERYATFTFVVK